MSDRQDFYGSNARRAFQSERDARDIAKPVYSMSRRDGVDGLLALRPIEERIAAKHDAGPASEPGKGNRKRHRLKRAQRRRRIRARGY